MSDTRFLFPGGGEAFGFAAGSRLIDDAFTISLNFLRFSFDSSNGLL